MIDVPALGHARRRPSATRRDDLVAAPLPRRRDSRHSVSFLLPSRSAPLDETESPPEEATLQFRLALESSLGYVLVLRRGARSWAVGSGRYDEPYPDTDAYAFLSPDRRKVALVVFGQKPYRFRGVVHFMRLPVEVVL